MTAVLDSLNKKCKIHLEIQGNTYLIINCLILFSPIFFFQFLYCINTYCESMYFEMCPKLLALKLDGMVKFTKDSLFYMSIIVSG